MTEKPVPFVGGSYELARKKADVQRTINMCPTAAESGAVVNHQYVSGAKAQWFLQSIPGLRQFSDAPAPPPPAPGLVDCDLLLHFDEEGPSDWDDWSVNERTMTLHTNSGTINGYAPGVYDRAMSLTQLAPGSGVSANFGTQAYLTASGLISIGDAEFFWSAWVKVPALINNNEQFVVCGNRVSTDGLTLSGFEFGVHRNDTLSLSLGPYGSFAAAGGTARVEAVSNILANTWTHIAVSRKRRPGNPDDLSVFIDGIRSATSQISSVSSILDGDTESIVGAVKTFGVHAPSEVAYGFQGQMDEVFLGHGVGWGIYDDFTPPTGPYVTENPLPPVS